MALRLSVSLFLFLFGFLPAVAQRYSSQFPSKLLIARHTFFDFGPPFDYYEVTTVDAGTDGLNVEWALVTPEGDACFQPPKVEVKTATLHASMSELLNGNNPCNIPEKDLRKELKRCKHCAVFSGAEVTMHVACGGNARAIRMDILDRDMFDAAANTPEQTSWTMRVMGSLDKALGPGVMEKPMFDMGSESSSTLGPKTIFKNLRSGEFDGLFHSAKTLSEIAREASQSPSVPSVILSDSFPVAPIKAELPKYPPIARAAHVEGAVSVDFQVTPEGQAENVSFNGDKLLMLHGAVEEAVWGWKFPESRDEHAGHATIEFKLNCPASTKPR